MYKKLCVWLATISFINSQHYSATERPKGVIKVCEYCTCSEIPNEDGTHLVLNIQCSELDRIDSLPDLDKVEWPENTNALKISAAFEGLGLSTLGKLPANPQVESLRFNNNAIKTYWPDPFSDLPNVRKLSFAQNDLTEITPDLFTNIDRLEDLDLSYNKITGFSVMDFKSLHLVKRFNLQSNGLKKIPAEALQPMTSLEDLDLSKNGIFDLLLQRHGAETLRGVKRLNLHGNRIRTVTKESFPENNYIEFLDLSSNIIENVEEDSFLACSNLRELNLGQNNITFIFALPSTLQIFIMKQNTLHRWPQFPAGITYVDLSYNRLTEMYGDDANLDNLEVLNIAGNQIRELAVPSKLTKLFSLDVSYNLFQEIPGSLSAENFPTLEELRLDGNPLQSIYFKNILSIKALYMNELSQLHVVENKAFSNVIGKSTGEANDKTCFTLHLSSCRSLSEIDEGAFAGTAVCMLDISNNNLTHLSPGLLPWSQASDGVDLQWNPWSCSCDLQWVLDDLLPRMYRGQARLLAQLRCASPRAVQGLRLVHWYNWTDRVLCSDNLMTSGAHSTYLLEPTTQQDRSVFSEHLTVILASGIVVALLIAVALTVYLIRGRRRYRVRQAALRRKRQSALDARNSNGQQKEQYSVLNKA